MSNEDKLALEQNTATIKCKLIVKASGDLPEIILTEDNSVKSWEYTDSRLVPNKGFIGQFVSRTLNGELQNISDDFDIDGREIDFQFIVVRINDNVETSYNLGSFIVVDPNDDDVRDSTKFETMDYAKKFNKTFDGDYIDENFPDSYNTLMGLNTPEGQTPVVTPVTALWVAQYACAQVGVELATTTFRNSDFSISQNPFQEGNSCRDVIKAVAQLALSWARIGWDNRCYIDFNVKDSSDVDTLNVLDNNQYFTLEKQSTYGPINRIVWGMENIDGESYVLTDEQSIATNGEHTLYIYDNAFTYTYELRVQAAQAASALFGLTYTQLKTETVGHPWFLGTEYIDIKDMNNNHNYLYPFNRVLKYNGHIRSNIESIGETNVDDTLGYTNELEKLARRTAFIVNKQEGTIDSLVSDMYDPNGLVQGNFTTIHQDITQVVTNVQNSGGNNLLRNSVMFARDANDVPSEWDVYVKNIFTGWTKGKYLDPDTGAETDNNTAAISDYIPIDITNDTKYMVSGLLDTMWSFVAFYDSNKTYINRVSGMARTGLLIEDGISLNDDTTLSSSAKYIRITQYEQSGLSGEIDDLDTAHTQIEMGDEATSYETPNGQLIIQTDTESIGAGCISGNSFTLLSKHVSQKIVVKQDSNTIPDGEKTYYTFTTNIRKNAAGSCYVKIYNSNENYMISIPSGTSSYYGSYEIKDMLPKDTYYIIEMYGTTDANATFTDNMFSVGRYKTQWQQSAGEIMNTQVSIDNNGVLVKSSVYDGDYTVMSPLEFAGYANINGTLTQVFTLNKDTTEVDKLKAKNGITMAPIKIVPVTTGSKQGWAFVPSTEEV